VTAGKDSRLDAEAEGMPLSEQLALVRAARWRISGIALGCGVVAALLSLTVSNSWRARAVLTPTGDDSKAAAGALGALASFGLSLGGPSKIEDLESLMKSDDLTARVFANHDFWGEVYGDKYDPAAKLLRQNLLERLLPGKPPKPLGDWDAIRVADNALKVSMNKKAGTLQLTFESRTPEGCAAIVSAYLDEARDRLQDEALDRAKKNKAFIQQQIATTNDALARDRLFSLLGQELEKEMMARNRESLGFKLIDAPRAPDRKAGPARALISVFATLVGGFLAVAYTLAKGKKA
jgi:uncharacterized protein involved in exopolysaccharide biosynthesis